MWPAPEISHFTLEPYDPPIPQGPDQPPVFGTVTVFGSNFHIRAIAPEVSIGDLEIREVRITNDENCLILFLFEMPPESPITVRYGTQSATSAETVRWPAPSRSD